MSFIAGGDDAPAALRGGRRVEINPSPVFCPVRCFVHACLSSPARGSAVSFQPPVTLIQISGGYGAHNRYVSVLSGIPFVPPPGSVAAHQDRPSNSSDCPPANRWSCFQCFLLSTPSSVNPFISTDSLFCRVFSSRRPAANLAPGALQWVLRCTPGPSCVGCIPRPYVGTRSTF